MMKRNWCIHNKNGMVLAKANKEDKESTQLFGFNANIDTGMTQCWKEKQGRKNHPGSENGRSNNQRNQLRHPPPPPPPPHKPVALPNASNPPAIQRRPFHRVNRAMTDESRMGAIQE